MHFYNKLIIFGLKTDPSNFIISTSQFAVMSAESRCFITPSLTASIVRFILQSILWHDPRGKMEKLRSCRHAYCMYVYMHYTVYSIHALHASTHPYRGITVTLIDKLSLSLRFVLKKLFHRSLRTGDQNPTLFLRTYQQKMRVFTPFLISLSIILIFVF